MNNELISVIMPCFNAEKTITESIESVLRQDYGQLELIVIDNGSSDGSQPIIDRFAAMDDRVRNIRQSTLGVSTARNTGIEAANGKYIAFLDSDDYWAPSFLGKLHSAITTSDAHLAYCGWQNVGRPGKQGAPFVPPDYSDVDRVDLLLGGNRWPIHAALSYRTDIVDAGGFDQRLTHAEDYLLWLKISTRYPIVRVPEVLAYYIHHSSGQATKNLTELALQHLRAQRYFLNEFPQRTAHIPHRRLRELLYGQLLRKGYECYWNRHLDQARVIFKEVMRHGYGSIKDWMYMLPSVGPLWAHRAYLAWRDSKGAQLE